MKIFETTAGEQIEYGPIALEELQLAQNVVEQEHRENGAHIDPPTYKVEVLGGTKEKPLYETHQHTKETIETGTDEEKILWAEHLKAVERMRDDVEEKTAWLFLEAIKVKLPDDDKWIKRRKKFFNEDVPEDEDERLLLYVNKELLKTPADKNGIMESIIDLSMTGAPQEVKQAYKDLFRREMEQTGRAIAEYIKTVEGTGQEMVLQSLDAKRDGGQRVGDVAKPVQKATRKRSSRTDGTL